MAEAQKLAAEERSSLQSLAAALKGSMDELASSQGAEKARLAAEAQRLTAQQAAVEKERTALAAEVQSERQRLDEWREQRAREEQQAAVEREGRRAEVRAEEAAMTRERERFARERAAAVTEAATREAQATAEAQRHELEREVMAETRKRLAAERAAVEAKAAELEEAKAAFASDVEALKALGLQVQAESAAVREAMDRAHAQMAEASRLKEEASAAMVAVEAEKQLAETAMAEVHEGRKAFENERLETAKERKLLASEKVPHLSLPTSPPERPATSPHGTLSPVLPSAHSCSYLCAGGPLTVHRGDTIAAAAAGHLNDLAVAGLATHRHRGSCHRDCDRHSGGRACSHSSYGCAAHCRRRSRPARSGRDGAAAHTRTCVAAVGQADRTASTDRLGCPRAHCTRHSRHRRHRGCSCCTAAAAPARSRAGRCHGHCHRRDRDSASQPRRARASRPFGQRWGGAAGRRGGASCGGDGAIWAVAAGLARRLLEGGGLAARAIRLHSDAAFGQQQRPFRFRWRFPRSHCPKPRRTPRGAAAVRCRERHDRATRWRYRCCPARALPYAAASPSRVIRPSLVRLRRHGAPDTIQRRQRTGQRKSVGRWACRRRWADATRLVSRGLLQPGGALRGD